MAFRLCIASSDRDKLLNEDKWPQSVIISEWYRGKPGRRDPARLPTTATAAAAATTDEAGDNTVIYRELSNDIVTDMMDQDTAGVHGGVQTTDG